MIAAAGRSQRMGTPKQLLPWGNGTVIAAVASGLHAAGAAPIVCVLGHAAGSVQAALQSSVVKTVYNADHATSEMARSYQLGVEYLAAKQDAVVGTLLSPGDQPHLSRDLLRRMIAAAVAQPHVVVIPSHERRRGHPIYLPRALWPSLLALDDAQSLRDLLDRHADSIHYVDAGTDAIRRDMDTPADYAALLRDFG